MDNDNEVIIRDQILPIYHQFLRQPLSLAVQITTEQSICIQKFIQRFYPSYGMTKIGEIIDMMHLFPVFETMMKQYSN